MEELAKDATGNPQAFVYVIGDEYKLLEPGVYPSMFLSTTERKAEKILRQMARERKKKTYAMRHG